MATNWDKLVTDTELKKAKALRSKTFITQKERRVALSELEEEGWVHFKDYKDPKFIGVRRDKPFYEQFEDKVWMLFASLSFHTMNADDTFKMSYDFNNPAFTQQIDVFAADDETVIIVECKSAEKLTDGNFKKNIESFHGQMDGLQKEARKRFPKCKVKFIWAVQNYIMSPADVAKLNEWNIALFDEPVIDYYIELTKHLGSSAKYQLLGNLFANQDIKNMDCRIPAIQGKMGKHTYYSFSIEPEKLLKIGYVLHHNKANESMMPAYQRLIKKKRLTEVRNFINSGGYFPNSIIISIDTNGRGIKFEQSATRVEGALSRIGVLHLPQRYRSAYIIDGQHRLYGYSDSEHASNNSIPVVAFIDLEKSEQVQLFMDINENQKAVPKSLRVTLNADILWVSDDYNERRQALRSKVAQLLGERNTSPLLGRIVIGENEKSSTRCITIEAIQNALKKCHFFTSFQKKNVPDTVGTFDTGSNDTTCDIFYPFLEGCLKFIQTNLNSEWEKGESDKGILTINRGIHGIIRVIDDIILHLIAQGKANPRTDKTPNLVDEVTYYLEPLISFFNELSDEMRDEMRHYLGGGADTKYWRIFQKAIAAVRSDFKPDGLAEWLENETKSYNDDAFRMVDELQAFIKSDVAEQLADVHGKTWAIAGVPKTIALRLQNEATEQNYDNAESGLSVPDVQPWDCVTLDDIQKIITYASNWQNTFEVKYADPLTPKGDKTVRTKWLSTLHGIGKRDRNKYSVPKAEYEWVRKIYDWLITTTN